MRAASIALGLCVACAAAPSSTPNVLFIAVDDLRPEHGVFGGSAKTPNIDAFAANATVFLRNYVQIGVCSPSRTSLLTGRYPHSTHVTDLYKYFRSVGCNVTTLPEAFKDAGYTTVGANKVFHPGHASGAGLYPDGGGCPGCDGYNDPPSWSSYFIAPSNAVSPWNITYGDSWTALRENATYPFSSHPDAQAAAHIIAALKSFKEGGQAFFAAPGFMKPHLPFIFPSRFLDQYADYNETAPDEEPARPAEASLSWTGWSEFSNYADIAAVIAAKHINLSTPGNYMPRAKQVEIRKAYLAAVSFNDAVVGLVLDALRSTGLEDSTVVVLWGDHGWMLNDGGDYAKHTNFESVTRAPLIIKSPRHPASWGARITAFTHHVDVFPTLLELTGLDMPGRAALEGLSLVPLLQNPALPSLPGRPAAAFSQYPRHQDGCGLPGSECGNPHAMGFTIRTAEWRYTEWVDFNNNTYMPNFNASSKVREVELWDHRGDVDGSNWTNYERSNLAGDPQYASVIASLSTMLHSGPNVGLPPAQQ